ncbi:MAG TPA: hypothetical protein VMV46_15080 [Thermoanaerobaculia bacterium]|nr:hypothetical protein [Thermoanaerobaculia bacterium]
MPDLPPIPPDPGADDSPVDEPAPDRPGAGDDDEGDRGELVPAPATAEAEAEAEADRDARGSGLEVLRQQVITRLGETQQTLLGLIEHFQAEQKRAADEAEAARAEQHRELAAAEQARAEQQRALETAEAARAEQREALAAAEAARAESEEALEAALAARDELERAREAADRARREAEDALELERQRADEAQQHAETLAAAQPQRAFIAPATATPSLMSLRHSLAAIDSATTQTEVLSRLLEEATAHAGRAALLLPRDDSAGMRLWNAIGFGDSLEQGASVDVPASFARALDGRPLAGEEARWDLDDEQPPEQAAVVPMVLRDRTRALLYADRTAEAQPFDRDALQLLTFCAAQALETLPLRSLRPSGTLIDATPALLPEPAVGEPSPGFEAEIESPEPAVAGDREEPAADEWSLGAALEEEHEEAVEDAASAAELEGLAAEHAGDAAATEAAELETVTEEDGWDLSEETEEAGEPEPEAGPEPGGEEDGAAAEGAGLRMVPPPPPVLPPGDPAATPLPPPPPTFPRAVPAQPTPEPGDRDEVSALDDGEPALLDVEAEAAGGAAAAPAEDEEDEEDESAGLLEAPEAAPPDEAAEPLARGRVEVEADEEQDRGDQAPLDDDEFRTQAIRLDRVPTRGPASFDHPPPRGPEVIPPSDIQGPGWAFTGESLASDASEEPLHEEARRLARLLVSEIKLYNEEQIEEGRRKGNIYRCLKEPIDRSRMLYEERIDERVRAETDYYHDELVRSLAHGDAGLLGV